MSAISDEQLLREVQGGDPDSLGVLVQRWERPLFRFVHRMLPQGDDARDVCQETFLRILDHAHRFREGSRFSTWMYQIALNLCRDHARKKRRWGRIVSEEREPPERGAGNASAETMVDPEIALARTERSHALLRALDQIPAEQRAVLVLKEFEGLKFREIAEVLGCPESTVKSRMYYGLSGVRDALARQGITGP